MCRNLAEIWLNIRLNMPGGKLNMPRARLNMPGDRLNIRLNMPPAKISIICGFFSTRLKMLQHG